MIQITSRSFVQKVMVTTLLAFVLTSCSSGPTPKTEKDKSTQKTQIDQDQQQHDISAQRYLDQAGDAALPASLELLVRASEQYLVEEQYYQALWLATQNDALISVSKQPESLSAMQHYRSALVKAHSLVTLNDIERTEQQLEQAQALAAEFNLSHQLSYFETSAQLQGLKNNAVLSIEAQLQAFSLNTQAGQEQLWQIWQQLTQLSTWQVKQLKQSSAPFVNGWTQLLSYAQRFGADKQQFSRYLQQWQREFTQHPAKMIIETILAEKIDTSQSYENIAVILPLSGKQKAAGLSAQQGILLAYQNNPNKELHFIDSNQVDFTTLNSQFQQLSVDAVIGPLLKSNVEQYLQLPELTLPTLLLNVPAQPITAENIAAFSMRPEDEAIQAASMLSIKKYQHPMVLTQKDATSERIAQSFAKQWQNITGQTPEILAFEPGTKMQNEIKASLEVDRSISRINELKLRLKQNFKHEARNRRDVDMIYLVGTSQESRLLKPYIDVNISPFADLVPIYASSRSHSPTSDSGIYNDLYGLTFTEIPWLLPSKQQNSLMAQQADALWPQQSVNLKRIFAMGYDSIALIDKLNTMKADRYVRHYGQTGTLQLTDNNILTRSLLWGRYQRTKVKEIAMD